MAEGGRLTVHVLDVVRGRPAGDLDLMLFRIVADRREVLGSWRTNADGRLSAPLLEGAAYVPGAYELVFAVGDWQARLNSEPGLYDEIPIRFRVLDAGTHIHVPLLLAPYGYSTYRGS